MYLPLAPSLFTSRSSIYLPTSIIATSPLRRAPRSKPLRPQPPAHTGCSTPNTLPTASGTCTDTHIQTHHPLRQICSLRRPLALDSAIISTTPSNLLPAIYLTLASVRHPRAHTRTHTPRTHTHGQVAPAYENVELGIGDFILVKALAESCGGKTAMIKEKLKEEGGHRA